MTEPAPQAPAWPAAAPPLPGGQAPRRRLLRRADAAVLPGLAILGGLLALWGVLLLPMGAVLGGQVLSAGAGVGIVGNVLFARLAVRASAPFGGAALLVGWLVVVFLAASPRANGSVVLPAGGPLAASVLVFVYGGLVAGLLAALVRVPR